MSNLAGERADYLGPDGYLYVDIDGKTYRAEYLVWFYVHGEYREDIIHIDGDITNNRLDNLRIERTN